MRSAWRYQLSSQWLYCQLSLGHIPTGGLTGLNDAMPVIGWVQLEMNVMVCVSCPDLIEYLGTLTRTCSSSRGTVRFLRLH